MIGVATVDSLDYYPPIAPVIGVMPAYPVPANSFRSRMLRSEGSSGVGVACSISWFFASSITTFYRLLSTLITTRASGVRRAVPGVAGVAVRRLLVKESSRDACSASIAMLLLLHITSPPFAHTIALISASLTTGAGKLSFARLVVTRLDLSKRFSCIIASGRFSSVSRLNRRMSALRCLSSWACRSLCSIV